MKTLPALFLGAGLFYWGSGYAQVLFDRDELKDHLLVVYNTEDPDSEPLARYYAEKRVIGSDRVLSISCPITEEIDRTTYEKQILQPINDYLIKQGWLVREGSTFPYGAKTLKVRRAARNQIWSIVLMRGVPLKIAHDPTRLEPLPEGQNPTVTTNAAAVDSELATLPIQGYPLSGFQPNSYAAAAQARNFDALDAKSLILVARLDAPSAPEVKRMIDDSLAAEQSRLVGRAYLDARGLTDSQSGYFIGDTWLRRTQALLLKNGWPSELDDKPEVYSAQLPWSNVALYAGWYANDAEGPFMHSTQTFQRGAIAYHIHSFSASTVHSTTANWVGPLLSRGAAATMGSVYEPYLDLTPHVDIFFDRLLQGYSLAEAAYASQKCLSWMTTVVGDPLYRPFHRTLEEAILHVSDPFQRDWLKLQQVRTRFGATEIQPLRDRAQELIKPTDVTAVAWEGYADLLSRPEVEPTSPQIPYAYQQAQLMSTAPVDQIRIGFKLASEQAQRQQWKSAYSTLEKLAQRFPREAIDYGLPQVVQRLVAQPGRPPLPPRLQQLIPVPKPVPIAP